MPLSLDYTAHEVWRHAVRDLQIDDKDVLDFEKFEIINRAVVDVLSLYYSLNIASYLASSALTLSTNTASLSAIRIMRAHADRCSITSSSLSGVNVSPITLDELLAWRTGANQNTSHIAWSLLGNSAEFRKGDSVSSYGTVTLYYPALPTEVAADATKLDVPDGEAIELVILRIKRILSERYLPKPVEVSGQMQAIVRALIDAKGIGMTNEEVSDKVKALN